MILALDMGNSNIVIGCIDSQKTYFVERVTTDHAKTGTEYAINIKNILEIHQIDPADIEGAIMSSVVPPLNAAISSAVKKVLGYHPMLVGAGIKTGMNIIMDNPKTVGSDMIVDAVAAIREYPGPIIIIDMGTATTMSVVDKNGNYIGGIIASWLKNGGTIEKSFNFGSLSTNTNCNGSSGTVGGIVGFFDQPTPGGTANILSCQNHGDILSSGNWAGDNNNKHGANDVAGILGKVVMADGTNDYLRINIVDCVNGDVKMQCESLAAGIMGWLGPDGSNVPDKVEVYIDRCRNYATDVKISPKPGDINLLAGICGNRGGNNSPKTSASTTVTNCFALYKNTVSSNNAPIAMNRSGRENIVAYGNYLWTKTALINKRLRHCCCLKKMQQAERRCLRTFIGVPSIKTTITMVHICMRVLITP